MSQRGGDPHRYGKSAHTMLKQRILRAILEKNMHTVRNMQRRYGLRPFLFLDAHAGPGIDEDGDLGSPLVALRLAEQIGLPFRMVCCEEIPERAETLRRHLAGAPAEVLTGDCRILLPAYLERIPARERDFTRGACYLDPTSAFAPWDVLARINALTRHLENIIHLSAGNLNRVRRYHAQHADKTMAAGMEQVGKKYWFLTPKDTSQHWTMLLASDWAGMQGIRGVRLVPLESEEGQAFFRTLNYTEKEREHLPWPGQGQFEF